MASVPFVEKIPALTQGISRQAPSVRFPGQVSDAKNINFSVVDGARKRRGTEYMNVIDGAVPAYNYRMHRIERDDEEEYAIVYGPGLIKIVDINNGDGASPSVVSVSHTTKYLDGTASGSSTSNYSDGWTEKSLKFVTIADVTFMVDTEVVPAVTTEDGFKIDFKTMPLCIVRTSAYPSLAFEFRWGKWKSRSMNRQIIKKRSANSGMYVYHLGDRSTLVPYNASAEQVEKAISGNGVDPNELLQEIIKQVSVRSGNTQTTTTVYTGENRCIDPAHRSWQGPHPSDPWPGGIDTLAVVGLPGFPYGKVVVTGGPINRKDMIIQVSTDVQMELADSFTASATTVEIGDIETDPPPPFAKDPLAVDTGGLAGLKIRDIGYLRNRLMIAADEFVCFSAIDDMFNFYMEEPPNLIDSDPISIQLAANDVCLVDYIVPFRKSIVILTSSGQQFELTGGDTLAPDTAAVSPSTKYETQKVRPVQIGNRLYMAGSGQAGFSTLLEYFYDEAQVSNIAVDLTKHVDDLIPQDIIAMDSSPSQEMVMMIPAHDTDLEPATIKSHGDGGSAVNWNLDSSWQGDEIPQPYDTAKILVDDIIYIGTDDENGGGDRGVTGLALATGASIQGRSFVYRSYNVGNERKQSSWTEWTFGSDRIMDAATYDDSMVILRRATWGPSAGSDTVLCLENLDLSELPTPPAGFLRNAHLDHRLHFPSGTGTWDGTYTTVTLSDSDAKIPDDYLDFDLDRVVLPNGTEYAATINAAGDGFTVEADIRGVEFYAGRAVRAQLELSQAFARDKEKRPITEGRTVLKKTIIEHRRTSEYLVDVINTQEGRTRSIDFTPNSAGVPETGTLTVWCQGESKDTTVYLDSTNAAPCIWTSVETHGSYDTQISE